MSVLLAAPATTRAENAGGERCISPRVRRQVLSCPDEPGERASGAMARGRSLTSRVASRQTAGAGPAHDERRQEPTVDAPAPPPGPSRRQSTTCELLQHEAQLLSRLVDNTPADHPELPNRLLRLAQAYDDLASMSRDSVRALDQPIYEARRVGDAERLRRLTGEQRAHEREEVRWRVEAIRRYRRVSEEFPHFPGRDEVLYRQGSSLEELAEGEARRREVEGGERGERGGRSSAREQQLRQEARRAYQELIRVHPGSRFVPHAFLAFAEHYFQEGDMAAAQRLYDRAAQDPASSVYGYAVYRRAWCHINLQQDREAVSDFVTVLQWAAADSGRPMSAPLSRSARLELIAPFSRAFPPAQAWAFFQRVGADHAPEMMEALAQHYYDQGQWTESVTAYRTLMAHNAASEHLCLYQARVADATRRGRRVSEELLELRRAVDVMDTFVAGSHPEATERECRQEVAQLVVDMATSWHQEAVGTDTSPGTNDSETMRRASELYELALTRLGDLDGLDFDGWSDAQRPTTYRVRYWAAELLFRRHRWAECGPAFDRVVAIDRDGEYSRDAAYAAVLCYDNFYEEEIASSPRPERGQGGEEPPVEALAPRELSSSEEAMISAFQRYTCRVPDGEDHARVSFRRAMVYYDANRFEEAAVLFDEMARSMPGHELAPLAAQYSLDALNALRRLHGERGEACEDAIDDAAGRYLADDRMTLDEEVGQRFAELRCGVRWYRAERRSAARDFAGCAEQYLAIYRDFGAQCRRIGDHGLDEVLYNAAICLESDSRIGPAIQVRRRLIDEFGADSGWAREHGRPSPLAQRALYQIGGNYHAIAAYTKAAESYQRFAKEHPGEEDAPDALRNATIFWLGLGERERALEASRTFETNYGRRLPGETARVAGAVGGVYLASKQWPEAAAYYRSVIARYGTKAPADELIVAHVNLGFALWNQRGHQGERGGSALPEFRRALAVADRGRREDETGAQRLHRYRSLMGGETPADEGDVDEARRLVRMVNSVAKARFYVAEDAYERFVSITLPPFEPRSRLSPADRVFLRSKRGRDEARAWEQALGTLRPADRLREVAQVQFDRWTDAELVPWVARRDEARARAEAAFLEVVAEDVPEWEIAAAARVGDMTRLMMQSFYDVPMPPIVRDDPELRDIYEDMFNERARPYREAAVGAYEHCLAEATRNRWFNQWSRDCERQLHELDPQEYPIADELRTEPDHAGAPLATPGMVVELGTEGRDDPLEHR